MAVKYGHVDAWSYVGPERVRPSREVHSKHNGRVHHALCIFWGLVYGERYVYEVYNPAENVTC